MPRARRALLPRACLICGQEWTPQTSKQAQRRHTCSVACAGVASGRRRKGQRQTHTSDPAGRACAQCGLFQTWDAFAWTIRGRKRSSRCRTCVSAYNRAYRAQYGQSINAEHRRKLRAGEWQISAAAHARRVLLRRYRRADRQVARARETVQLVGAYFRAYAASPLCLVEEREELYLQARMTLAWLLRSHCWCEHEAIAVLLRTSPPTIDWYIGAVRAAIRDRHSRGPGQIGAGQEARARLKGHAQECLRRAEGHAPGSLEPLAQAHEDEQPYAAPTALDTYWRKRAAQQEREQRYGTVRYGEGAAGGRER